MEFARKRNELVTSEANMENDKKSDLPNDWEKSKENNKKAASEMWDKKTITP